MAFNLAVLHDLIFRLRKQYSCTKDKLNGLGPLILTEYEFASGVAHQAVKESEHEAISRKLRTISARIDRAADSVDTIERVLCIKTRWQPEDAEYVKMLEYITNRKFVCVVEELQGLVVSRLMELDKMNLAGSGTYWVSL
jgi:hypothetical protein